MLLTELVFLVVLPFPFMVFALKEYNASHVNIRLIFMLITAFAFSLSAAGLLMSENDVRFESRLHIRDELIVEIDCFPNPLFERINCRQILLFYPVMDIDTESVYLTPCDLGGGCVATAYVLAGVYGGMAVLFTVLTLSEAFVLSARSVGGARI